LYYTRNEYDIIWSYKAENGTQTSDTGKVKYNVLPAHANPETVTVDHRIYTFASWSPAVEVATENNTYTATYIETCETGYHDNDGTCAINEYDITWSYRDVDGGLTSTTDTLAYGSTPTPPSVPLKC
jgi:hypothetical protein